MDRRRGDGASYAGRERRRALDDSSEQPEPDHDDEREQQQPDEPQPVPTTIAVDVQSLPSWLRAAVLLGVPSVIALYLVYSLTAQMSRTIATMETQQQLSSQTLTAVSAALTARQNDATETRQHFDEVTARLERLIRQTCIVAAQTDEVRARCLSQ